MNFLYIIYGDKDEFHAQAKVSILSLLRFLGPEDHIHVLSDKASPYEIFKEQIQWHNLQSPQFAEWFGPKRFFFRSKPLGMKWMMKKVSGDFCYLDTDVFAVKSLAPLRDHVKAGGRAMFDCERRMSRARDPLSKDYWSHLSAKTFASEKVPNDLFMWNAGLVAISPKDLPLLDKVVSVTDEILKLPKLHVAFDEQLAHSIVFQNLGEIYQAKKEILHYWGNKTNWNKNVFDFAEKYLKDGMDLEKAQVALKDFPLNLALRIHAPFWPKLKNSFRKRIKECQDLISRR